MGVTYRPGDHAWRSDRSDIRRIRGQRRCDCLRVLFGVQDDHTPAMGRACKGQADQRGPDISLIGKTKSELVASLTRVALVLPDIGTERTRG